MDQIRDNIIYDILEQLQKSPQHVRAIARNTGESHSTIARKLIELQKENIIDAREEGRNKIFYLKKNLITRNLLYQMELYLLTCLVKKYPKLQIIFEEVLDRSNEPCIVLFGSYAKGLAHEESDIDLYIPSCNQRVKKEIESLHSKLSVKIGTFDKDLLLIKEIMKNRKIIRGIEIFYQLEGKHI